MDKASSLVCGLLVEIVFESEFADLSRIPILATSIFTPHFFARKLVGEREL